MQTIAFHHKIWRMRTAWPFKYKKTQSSSRQAEMQKYEKKTQFLIGNFQIL